jgi:hypothetical protein
MFAAVSRTVSKPFALIHRNAVQRIKVAYGPIALHIRDHEKEGTDLTQNIYREYFDMQSQLFSYRAEKLREEINFFLSGGLPLTQLGFVDWVLALRFVARLLFVYMVFVMIGRGSVHPPLEPGSPFITQLQFDNPNWTNPWASKGLLHLKHFGNPEVHDAGVHKSGDSHGHGHHH